MNYELTQKPTLSTSECLVLGVFSDAGLAGFALDLDKEHHGLISRLIEKTSEIGDIQWHHDVHHGSILIIQCGEQAKFTSSQLKKRLGEITGVLIKHRIRTATVCLPLMTQYSADWQLEQMVIQIDNQSYQLLDFKKKKAKPHQLETIIFICPMPVKTD